MNFMKQIRKFRRETRAISPVIATLLMIAIAVVASLVTYAWVMGYMNFQTEKTGKAIQIQSITYDGAYQGSDYFSIYVQNVGDSDVKLSSVFINGAAATGVTFIPSSGDLVKESTSTISATSTLSAGVQQVTIKVTTTDGTFSEITKQFTIE
jgi:archaeal type IV pilus assembly protein PilA